MEQVPSLEINGNTFTQSIAICEYLEETYPANPIYPSDPILRARVREIVMMICSGIQPIQNLSVLQYLGNEKKAEWGHYWIDKGFEVILCSG